ncbi:MAG: hypothetical protein ACXWUG_13570 [Polyangiales bacterium]
MAFNDQFPGATEKEARASLEEVVGRLDGPILRGFEEPPKEPKKKRR